MRKHATMPQGIPPAGTVQSLFAPHLCVFEKDFLLWHALDQGLSFSQEGGTKRQEERRGRGEGHGRLWGETEQGPEGLLQAPQEALCSATGSSPFVQVQDPEGLGLVVFLSFPSYLTQVSSGTE